MKLDTPTTTVYRLLVNVIERYLRYPLMIIQCDLDEPCGLMLLIAITFVYNDLVECKSIVRPASRTRRPVIVIVNRRRGKHLYIIRRRC